MLHTIIYGIVTGAVLGGAFASPLPIAPVRAPAQSAGESQNDLRQENDRLQQQVRSLQGDLEAAQKRIKELEERLSQLERMARSTEPSSLPAEVLPDPALGPGGLLTKLRNEYAAEFLSKDIPASGPGTDQASQQSWAAFKRTLDPWITRSERSPQEVRWVGTINPEKVTQSGTDVTFEVVFSNGGRDFPTPVTISQGMAARLRGADGAFTREPVTVNAVVVPKLRVNPARHDAGTFDRPPLVGPFVEFGYELKTKVVLPPERQKTPPASPPHQP